MSTESLPRARRPHSIGFRPVAFSALILGGLLWVQPAAEAPRAQGTAAVSTSIVVIEGASRITLEEVAAQQDLIVRWVELGLLIAETERPERLPARWGARVVGRRSPAQQLAILRAPDLEQLRHRDAHKSAALSFLSTARFNVCRGLAGDVWLLLASPGSWPQELLGCHGGLVLLPRRVDPRSMIDDGPPAALRPWVDAPRRPFNAAEKRLLSSISVDSVRAYWELLIKNSIGLPANRWAFASDLDDLYSPRAEAIMLRATAGVPAATVERQSFSMRRIPPGGGAAVVDSTYNVIGRLPGSVPGTGTFVVCAHIDATGSRDSDWRAAAESGLPLQTPGAEDNATGVAAVLEIMRCVADGVRAGDLDFAFDLEFVAFSGEEVSGIEDGLKGSAFYVARRAEAGTKLLAAFNMDMVGSDSLQNNLQIVHNTASTWMLDFIVDAVSQVDPPVDLSLTPDLDESRSSDHNSFWAIDSDAIMAADAPVGILRRYASYHRPIDVGNDVSVQKMTEVSRALLATLLRFNTKAHGEASLLFPKEKLALIRDVRGSDIDYSPALRLWPGAPLKAMLSVYSLGAPYDGPIRVEMQTQRGTEQRTVFVQETTVSAPTGSRLDFILDPVPIAAADGGTNVLVGIVTYEGSDGGDVVQTAADTFFVETQTDFKLLLRPNPVRGDPSASILAIELDEPGDIRIDVYNLEGELVTSRVEFKEPFITRSEELVELPVISSTSAGAEMQSGTYFVRVHWSGQNGQSRSAISRMVVIR